MSLIEPTWHMWATFAMIAAAIGAYASDRYPLEMVSAGIVIVLLLFFHMAGPMPDGTKLSPGDILEGFSSPGLFAIIGLLIVGQGMYQSGALERPTRSILALYEKRPMGATTLVFSFVLLVSAVLNNTPVVVMFIPIMAAIASQSGGSTSKLMIPLSFVSILGGMTTIIGSSTNLLANQAAVEAGAERLSFFAPTPIGLVLAATGIGYLILVGNRLLPDRQPKSEEIGPSGDGKQFIAQINLSPGHPLIGAKSVSGLFPDLPDVTVRMIIRREQPVLPPFDETALESGDVLIVAATRKTLTDLLRSKPAFLAGVMAEAAPAPEEGAPAPPSGELALVEAVVAPGSRMIGRTIQQIGFRYQTNTVLLGIQRRSRMIRARMNQIRLEAGDVLLILGDRADVRALRANRDILILEWSMTDLPDINKARNAGLIFAGVVAAAATGLAPIVTIALAGATAMVAAGCLNVRQASRAVDRRIFLLVGAAIAMGVALERTSGAQFLGASLVAAAEPLGPRALIAATFILTAGLTNVLSNNATAVLFAPVGVAAAKAAGVDPSVMVLTVIFGANCSFATPVAYQTNLLVMAPGHYAFSDYVRVGAPLIVLLWAVYVIIAPVYFDMMGLMSR